AWRREDRDDARMRDQVRTAARQWHDGGRQRGLLWSGDALAEYRLWRARFAGRPTRSEDDFAGASIRDERRRRRIRGAVLGAFVTALIVGLTVVAALKRRADASAAAAEESYLAAIEESGRRAALADEPTRALAYLEALLTRRDSPAVRFVVGRALRAVEPLERLLVTDGVSLASFALGTGQAGGVVAVAGDT